MTFKIGRGSPAARMQEAEEAEKSQENLRHQEADQDYTDSWEDDDTTFMGALGGIFSKPFGFSGTATRKEFGFKMLWLHLIALVAASTLLLGPGALIIIGVGIVVGIWILIWGIPLYVRRMRDAGYSGWMVLLAMIVIGVVNTIEPSGKVGNLLSMGLMLFLICAPSKY